MYQVALNKLLICVLSAAFLVRPSVAQEVTDVGGDCGRSTEVLYAFLDYSMLSSSGEKTQFEEQLMAEQFKKLSALDEHVLNELSGHPSWNVIPSAVNLEQSLSGGQFLKTQQKYIIYGFVRLTASDKYQLHLFLKSSCAEKVLAEADEFFAVDNNWDPPLIAKAAVSKLTSKINLREYELRERSTKKYGLGGDLYGGKIKITIPNKALQKGEEVNVLFEVQDCDGEYLTNKQISTEGTTGGSFTPSKFNTNAQGVGQAKFKLTSEKAGIIKAASEIKNVMGCPDLYTGSEIISAVKEGAYKVQVTYKKIAHGKFIMKAADQNFTMTLADEKFTSSVAAHITFYAYPKKGEKQINFDRDEPSDNVIFSQLHGYSDLLKSVTTPEIKVVPLNSRHKEGQDSLQQTLSYNLLTPNVSFSFKDGELNDFDIHFDFAEDEAGRATEGGVVSVLRGDKDSKDAVFSKKKVTDPKSTYKTEHRVVLSKTTKDKADYGYTTVTEFAVIIILSKF